MRFRTATTGIFGWKRSSGSWILALPLSLATVPDSSAEVDPDPIVLVGAGDIAGCGPQNDDQTAALLDGIPGTVFTLGDHAYPNATAQKFASCYDPSWGQHKDRTRPSAGDHDYSTAGASGYFGYFGDLAGNSGEGYYSYDLGSWHIIVLNSNCLEVGGCDADSPQGQWLQADLASNPSTCSLAYWHHARFSSGAEGSSASAGDLFQILYDAGADVVLNGHDHDYERFAPQDPDGTLDLAHGIRQFVVGTGGAPLQPFASVLPNSEVRNSDTHGVLKLTLHATSYEWDFVPIAGMSFTDSGRGDCIEPRQPPATTISSPSAGAVLMVGEPVSFVGAANDLEDGDLTGSLTWTSDRDGLVGTGGSFSTTTLSAGTHEISSSATNSGGLSGVALITITVTATAGETTLVEASVASSSDDAEESATGSVALGSFDLDLVHDQASGTPQTVGLRFPQVGIPRGANVSEAYVQFQASGISTGPGSLTIEGEAVDDASTFSSSGANVSSRPRTSAAVSWSPPDWLAMGEAGIDQRTPDIASVLEEIVSRPGWESGHSLSLIVTGTGTRMARAHDGDPMNAPSLHVSYQSLLFTDRVLTSDLVTDNRFYLACDTIVLGPDFHIMDPGSVVFRAGSRIIIENGFSVGSGAWVTMQLDPACTVDALPLVSIDAPADGSSFGPGVPVDFVGVATDEEDGDLSPNLSWVSDRDGSIGSGRAISVTGLSSGLHRVTARASDDGGLVGSDQITITVHDTPPSVSIMSPSGGSSFELGTAIDFAGTASDPEDGDLTASLTWISDLDGSVGSGGSFITSLLSPGPHTITASVTDSVGLTATDQITLQVFTSTPPGVSITSPASGASFDFGEAIFFSGTASDLEDGDLTAALSWTSDVDGEIGAGGSFTHAALSLGQHTITALVIDSEGLIGSDQLILTVNNTPPTVAIALPVDGASFDFDENVDFSGTASDVEDGDLTAALSWTSNVDGEIGTGGSFSHSALSLGQHTIAASVTDSEGLTGSDQIIVTVNNTPPTVAITLPVDGASFDFGENVDFSATASDLEDGDLTASLVWESDRDGSLGMGGSISTTTLSSGSHTITASAVDGEGLMGEASVNLSVGDPAATIVQARVVSSSDDAEEDQSGIVRLTSSDLELVEEASTQTVGIRFDGVDLPRDAAISNAYIQFQTDETGSAPTLLLIEGESADHSFAFVASSGEVSTRPRTLASVLWTAPAWTTAGEAGSGQRTPNLTPVIQEIVSRPGWSSGNALSVIITGTGRRTAEAYDGLPSGAPLLHVEYTGILENNPPQVTITTPVNGATFETGEHIVFSGGATDPEDGDLTSGLTWESNLDGVIGTGGAFVRFDLSEGTHIVSATAIDTDGLTAFDQAVLTVSPGGIVVVGAGDIATCSSQNDEATAALLDGISGTVVTFGDHVYPDGTAQEFTNCYDPTWGRHKWRTRPSTGNHDYHTPGASAYFVYFGAAAGNPEEGYYSYDLGSWHIIALNSNCSDVGGCGPGSPQGQWLQADLAANPSTCTLAYWHHPRFSSGPHGNAAAAVDLFDMLYQAGADVVLTAHDHDYERFAPQDSNGNLDGTRGIRQFVVGTGGASLYEFATIEPNSEVRYRDSHGVLKLTLHPTSYEWEFVPVAGSTFTDTGTGSCVVAP
ncbi:MAG TPA: metallophosphoesterase [Vicinamibacteria bacterium]|nr:metallophosphoesterase [Vicinamibacteria bacterium]